MNVAIIHYSSPPVVGGVENVLTQHARLMADAGNFVRILAGRGAQIDTRVDFIEIPLLDSRHPEVLAVKAELDRGCVPEQFYSLVDRITAALEQALDDVQVLVAHNVCSLNKNLALTAALKRISEQPRSPHMLLWHHDLAWTTPRYRSELYPGYPWDLLRTDWSGVQQVVVSELRQQELANLLKIPPERINVVPNGVDAIQFLSLGEQTRSFVDQLSLMEAEPFLLLPVRITPRKNIELALTTLAVLQKDFPNPVLVVTGPLGPHNPNNVRYIEMLRSLRKELQLENKAYFLAELFTGYLPDAVIAELYRLADALILPSREEGFGIPVLEAALVRMPLFCANIMPLQSLAGGNAYYFSPDANPETLAKMIHSRLMQDPTYRMRMHVRQNFTWEKIYQQYIAKLINKWN